MTDALKSAFKRAAKYPKAKQDELAAAFEEEMNAEEAWERRFAATSEEQYQKMADHVREQIETGHTTSSEDFFAKYDV